MTPNNNFSISKRNPSNQRGFPQPQLSSNLFQVHYFPPLNNNNYMNPDHTIVNTPFILRSSSSHPNNHTNRITYYSTSKGSHCKQNSGIIQPNTNINHTNGTDNINSTITLPDNSSSQSQVYSNYSTGLNGCSGIYDLRPKPSNLNSTTVSSSLVPSTSSSVLDNNFHLPSQRQISFDNTSDLSLIKKRKRKKAEEVHRYYRCNFQNCDKAYGTLNHLNTHISIQKHGPKRMPQEFATLRKQLRDKRRKHKLESSVCAAEKQFKPVRSLLLVPKNVNSTPYPSTNYIVTSNQNLSSSTGNLNPQLSSQRTNENVYLKLNNQPWESSNTDLNGHYYPLNAVTSFTLSSNSDYNFNSSLNSNQGLVFNSNFNFTPNYHSHSESTVMDLQQKSFQCSPKNKTSHVYALSSQTNPHPPFINLQKTTF